MKVEPEKPSKRNKMKVLVICQYYYPENFQITPICEQLVKDGYDVTVLTGLPNYPTGTIPDEYKVGHRNETINGVHIIRCHEIARKTGPVCLGLNYFSFFASAMKMVDRIKDNFDMVFCYQLSPVLMGLPAKKYAKKHNVPFVLYCCDLWPESMKMYLKNENNLLFRYIKSLSKKVYSAADLICCQSSSFVSYMQNIHRIDKNKVLYLPAFADDAYLKEDFNIDNGVVDFVFLGNLGIAQNMIGVLSAIKIIKDLPNFKVHFVGDGSCLEEMKTFVKENNMSNIVKFYGRRPAEEMPKYYKLADACLVSLKADNVTGLTFPAKVQGYMAAGKPIIGMINGSTQEIISTARCGKCVDADDVAGLAKLMKLFIEDPSFFEGYGENGRNYFVENFRKEIFIEKLENLFCEVAFSAE